MNKFNLKEISIAKYVAIVTNYTKELNQDETTLDV